MCAKKTFNELNDLLADSSVRRALIETAGENAIAVMESLKKASEDEKIAGLLSLRVSDVRSVLNRLNEEGFAYYQRTRNEETGWYSYYWALDMPKFKEWIHFKLFNRYEKLRLKAAQGEYYFCPKCGVEPVFSFEDAMEFGFKCPSCKTAFDFLEEDIIARLKPNIEVRKAPSDEDRIKKPKHPVLPKKMAKVKGVKKAVKKAGIRKIKPVKKIKKMPKTAKLKTRKGNLRKVKKAVKTRKAKKGRR